MFKKLLILGALTTSMFADSLETNEVAAVSERSKKTVKQSHQGPQGWSFDLGGQYTWMQFTTPPTFSGSTGGVVGKITYQKANEFYGQFRTVYNAGSLSAGNRKSGDTEWYTEAVGGYCVSVGRWWTITPYAGFGMDFLWDNKRAHSGISHINLSYRLFYVPIGVEFLYGHDTWYVGGQFDILPTFNQYLSIKTLTGAAWKMTERVGCNVRFPVGFKLANRYWIEMAPYYRLLAIGSSKVLGLPHRNLNEYGLFVAFRFFL